MQRLLASAVRGAKLPDLYDMPKPQVHQEGKVRRSDFAAEREAHAEDVDGSPVLPVRDVQEQEDRQQDSRAAGDAAAAAVRPLREVQDDGGLSISAVEQSRRTWPHSEVLRLLAPAVRRAKLPDMQGLPGSRMHQRGAVPRAYSAAECTACAADIRRRPGLPVREMPEAAMFTLRRLEGDSGFPERAAQAQQ